VLANEMFDQLRDRNFSLSSAFAVLIFGLTVPVMIINIRRSIREVGS
jgi:ABC-type sugar transport system permease subunit